MQSRGPRLNDVLSQQEVDEIASTPRGLTSSPESSQSSEAEKQKEAEQTLGNSADISRSFEDLDQEIRGVSQSVAQIRADGKVEVKQTGSTKSA